MKEVVSPNGREAIAIVVVILGTLLACGSSPRSTGERRGSTTPVQPQAAPPPPSTDGGDPSQARVRSSQVEVNLTYENDSDGRSLPTTLARCTGDRDLDKARKEGDTSPQTWCCNCLPPRRCVQGGGAPWVCVN